MAAGALSVVHGRGVKVPQDLSVTGFDDTPVSAIVWPPLTTVHQPLKDMGRRAVALLASRLTGGRSEAEPEFDCLDHAVVERGTAASAP